jgi:hypothetical protein
MWDRFGSILLVAVGIYSIIRAFRGKEFFLAGIGGSRGNKPLPNWIGRPLAFLFGIAAIILGVGGWFQK